MKRRILTVALALVLALVGTGLVLVYVKQADNRALAGQKAVTVLVATRLIPAGTSASSAQHDGLLRQEKLPAESVPADAVRAISAGMASQVASANIQPGQLLLRESLVSAALAQETGGIAVPTGMVGISVNLCLSEAVAQYIHGGSEVSVYDTSSPGKGSLTAQPNCSGTHEQQDLGTANTRLVLSKVEVLAVGQAGSTPAGSATATSAVIGSSSSSTSSQDPNGTTLVTLAVTPAQAKQLILLAETGLPYLALVN